MGTGALYSAFVYELGVDVALAFLSLLFAIKSRGASNIGSIFGGAGGGGFSPSNPWGEFLIGDSYYPVM